MLEPGEALGLRILEILFLRHVGGEIEELRGLFERIFEKLERGAKESGLEFMESKMKTQIQEAKGSAKTLIDNLENTATEIRKQVIVAREAV